MRQSYGFLLRIRRKLHSLTIISAKFAANVANLAETKGLVRSGAMVEYCVLSFPYSFSLLLFLTLFRTLFLAPYRRIYQ